jgi:hypothetical protein
MKGEFNMNSKIKDTVNNKNQDGKFKKKNIKHDPQAESSRNVFDDPGIKH